MRATATGAMRSTKVGAFQQKRIKRPCGYRWLSSGHCREVVSMWLVSGAIQMDFGEELGLFAHHLRSSAPSRGRS